MKRDFLKGLGIEDKDIIDKILNENSTDIGIAKGELKTYQDKVENLEKDIKAKEETIATLEKEKGDVAELNQKISQLETDKINLTNELETKVSKIQKAHAVEGKIRDAKGKNIKAIMALLDMEKITYENGEVGGIDDQLKTLASAEDSSMLFGEAQGTPPSGTHFYNPPSGGNGGNPATGKTLRDAVAEKFKN